MYKICLVLFLSLIIHPLFSQGYLEFIENKGQWNSAVKFKTAIPGGSLYLLKTGYKVILQNYVFEDHIEPNHKEFQSIENQLPKAKSVKSWSHAYEIRFLHANPDPQIIKDKINTAYYNYFIGNDSSKWASHCNSYNAITYKDIYTNIDIRFHTDNGRLKYDIIVFPGGDPSKVQLAIDGADNLGLEKGSLVIGTSLGVVKEDKPYTYQPSSKKNISASYILKEKTVHFSLGAYDKKNILIIDPEVIFASYAGGYSKVYNRSSGFSGAYDKAGNFFLSGIAVSDSFFISNGAYQTINKGGNPAATLGSINDVLSDMLISKFNPSGTQLICATFLGGAESADFPNSTMVDSQGNLVIAGASASFDYPVTGANYGPCGGITDIIVSRLSNDCTKLMQSRKIGGSAMDGINILFTTKLNSTQIPATNIGVSYSILQYNNDDYRLDITLDPSDNIYIASCTQSNDFPVSANAVQKNNMGGKYKQDAVIIKFSPDLSTLLYSSYLGGSQDDAAYSLAINPLTNDIYVAGVTGSNDFLGIKPGSVMPSYKGGIADGFICIFSNDGSIIRTASYMGTDGMDNIYAIRFDNKGSPYVTGTTTGNWPIINAAFSQPNAKQFIAKLKSDLSAFEYSTVFGTDTSLPNIVTTAFFIDRCEQVYVAGYGGTAEFNVSPNEKVPIIYGFPNAGTSKMTTTSDALSNYVTRHGGFYYFILGANASKQVYGSFFGSIHDSVLRVNVGKGDFAYGAVSRFDKNGVLYQAYTVTLGPGPSTAQNGYFPTTKGAWAENELAYRSMAAVKIAFNLDGVRASLKSNIGGIIKSNACLPTTIQFSDSIGTGKQYRWLFGDGSPETLTTLPLTTYNYNKSGTFSARLISIDSNTCNISDTSYLTIRTGTIKADIQFTGSVQKPCSASTLNFINTSSVSSNGKAFSANSFQWDFGDGTQQNNAAQSVNHSYAAGGKYLVKLILSDTNYCNSPDTLSKIFSAPSLIKAAFTSLAPSYCTPALVSFSNTSIGGLNYLWIFGDGDSSNLSSPTHTYSQSGSYTVSLKIKDNSSCNLEDNISSIVFIKGSPKSAFTYLPQPALPNTPITFTNLSVNSNNYKWLYGDGESVITNATTVNHLYNTEGQFKVCLIASNIGGGCLPDTSCQNIVASILPVVEVPTAFSPNGDGKNDVLKVIGFGIQKMQWRIYNRWGMIVFESTSPSIGWNGKLNGLEQNTGVYVYELEVTFTNGEKISKTGTVTLIK